MQGGHSVDDAGDTNQLERQFDLRRDDPDRPESCI